MSNWQVAAVVAAVAFFMGMDLARHWKREMARCDGRHDFRCVHGDEVNALNGARAVCNRCGERREWLPMICTETNTMHHSYMEPWIDLSRDTPRRVEHKLILDDIDFQGWALTQIRCACGWRAATDNSITNAQAAWIGHVTEMVASGRWSDTGRDTR
jgi:hypothetical protein